MAKKVQDVMTANPTTLPESATLLEAARRMRDSDIGDVIVMRDSELCGIATDRDIVVRAIADGKDPSSVALREVCSHDVTSVAPSDTIEHAVELMRSRAMRRLPVVDKGRPVGIVSLGDLALERDPDSALADISAAPANL